MNSRQVREYLDSFINKEYNLHKIKSSSFSLQNIKYLLKLMGNPQDQLKIIHVAGSKGKGSTCALIASILHCAGKRVGLYTSPHLYDVTERIRILGNINGQGVFKDAISEEEFCEGIEVLKPLIEKVEGLSYFEILTALAFFYFEKQNVEWVVLETGLGGRLDATNVGLAKVCVITSIGLEHVNILGNTLEKITFEKVSIVKEPQQKVVVAPQDKSVESVIKKYCKKLNVSVCWVGKDIEYVSLLQQLDLGQSFFIKGHWAMYRDLRMPLLGDHQLINATVAVGVIECLKDLGEKVSLMAVEEGAAKVDLLGRFEIIQKNPCIILDCAHTPDSVKALVQTFQAVFPNQKATLILGLSEDKDKFLIGKELDVIVDKIIVTKANHSRAVDFQESDLKKMFKDKRYLKTENVKEAMALIQNNKGVVLVTGSIFLVSEARKTCIN